jgi:hypothetical protein
MDMFVAGPIDVRQWGGFPARRGNPHQPNARGVVSEDNHAGLVPGTADDQPRHTAYSLRGSAHNVDFLELSTRIIRDEPAVG